MKIDKLKEKIIETNYGKCKITGKIDLTKSSPQYEIEFLNTKYKTFRNFNCQILPY